MSAPSNLSELATGDTLDASAGLAHAHTVASRPPLPLVTAPRRDDGDLARAQTMASGARAADPDPGADDTRDGAAPRRADASPLPRTLGRYHVLERLGSGGMGVVYAAYDPDLDRRVAVKLLRFDHGAPETQVRLLREAQALARLSHPNVVQIHDASVVGAQLFIAMEFVRGQDLRAWLAEQERSDSEILRVFLDAGRGLAAAHAEGLVHRDFKPENVLVGADGRVRVADFGLARTGPDGEAAAPATPRPTEGPLDLSLTATGAVLGTPAYMSPEQHTGARADARSDQFSFCVALWEALYRQRPFAGETVAEHCLAVLSGQVRPPPADTRVPRRIAGVLRRGLQVRPEQRHPDMLALLAALDRDPSRARRRWFAGAALFAMSTGTAFFVADRRAAEASACSGAAAELAEAWDPARRAAVADALAAADPTLAGRVLAGLDRYAARWAAGHRGACLDHRRGELSATIFDARVRCLERRRLALGSAVAALTAAEPAAEPAQVVARLPALDACDDPDSALSETTLPEDPALAAAARELDARLIDARTRYNAGDVRGTRAAADAVVAEARRLGLRPLLAEALLLRGRLDETEREFRRGRDAVDEAAVHALATRRDDLAAEALARRIFFDGQLDAVDDALADAPIARAVAERLPAPAAALARLENNLGHLFFMRRDIDGARPHFERATEALERTADGDPIERAYYWENLALVTRDPAAREQAFVRATSSLTQHLGDRHLLALDRRRLHGQHAADARTAAAMLGELCPRYPESYPDAYPSCVECFQSLGHLRAALGEREAAADAFAGVDVCLARSPDERAQAVRFADFHDRAAAFAALLRDRPEAALAHADAALARLEPYQSLWWIAAEIAELELARGRALLATGRPDEARAALTNALPVFEDLTKTTVLLLPQLWRDEARALLDRSPATP